MIWLLIGAAVVTLVAVLCSGRWRWLLGVQLAAAGVLLFAAGGMLLARHPIGLTVALVALWVGCLVVLDWRTKRRRGVS